ncbi:MAG: hypothetical protein PHI37_04575 [Candidatus Gracilibacteria bacterium]|nr:hypothetical protein [Candidatus Gracilibacteria bacterium]
MGVKRNFERLKASRYYNFHSFFSDYRENNNIILFLIELENIDLNQIRFSEKKILLQVLEYIFKNYRLSDLKSNYLKGFIFKSNYCGFEISEREYIILEKILILKEQLGGYYMTHYNIYYNIALDYINETKKYIIKNNINPFDKILADFKNFPGNYELVNGEVSKSSYKNLN